MALTIALFASAPFKVTVTVEEATGGAAPPTVTPDYARPLRVDVSPRVTAEGFPTPECPGPVTTTVGFSMHIRQSASDVQLTSVPCGCPG